MKISTPGRLVLILILFVLVCPTIFQPASGADAKQFPLLGSPCTEKSNSVSNVFSKYMCTKTSGVYTWQIQKLNYKTPPNYLKGFEIGRLLSTSNPRTSGDIRCLDSYYGRIAKNDLIQSGQVPTSTTKILSSYYGYLGCMDGADFPNQKPSASINSPEPLNAPGIWDLASGSGKPWSVRLRNGNQLNSSDFENLRASLEIGCSNEDSGNLTTNCAETLAQQQYPGAFNEDKTITCLNNRVDTNWTITGVDFILPTLSLDPSWDPNDFRKADPEFFTDREQIQISDQVPLRILSVIRYHDDINGDYEFYGWLHLLTWDNHTLVHFLSPCATFIESQASYSFDLPKAPIAFKIPSGKVDKTSNAYKTMFNVGKNFAKVSMASDTGMSQCSSALKSGMIRARGVPQYLGVQAGMLQSYLQTPSGFQGCLDGFGH